MATIKMDAKLCAFPSQDTYSTRDLLKTAKYLAFTSKCSTVWYSLKQGSMHRETLQSAHSQEVSCPGRFCFFARFFARCFRVAGLHTTQTRVMFLR
jgi:hypothetical protein